MMEIEILVIPAGFEPTTPGLGILCSILLSYGTSRDWTYQPGRQHARWLP